MRGQALKTSIASLCMLFAVLLAGCGAKEEEPAPILYPINYDSGVYVENLKPERLRNRDIFNLDIDKAKSKFTFEFVDRWDFLQDEDYQKTFENMFYFLYPKYIARFGVGGEPKEVSFSCDVNTPDKTFTVDNMVVVSAVYARDYRWDKGYFAHELAHVAEYYGEFESDWWAEGLATYMGFRYYHWAFEDAIRMIDQHSSDLINWYYNPDGNCALFFAYMDYMYPTTKDADGNVTYGLIDSIHRAIKSGRIRNDHNPDNFESPFNEVVYEVTGIDTIEDIRKAYVEACEQETWVFAGFKDYKDNFLTDGIENVPDSNYPMYDYYEHGTVSHEYTEIPLKYDEDVFKDATIIRETGFYRETEADSMLVDGSLDTRWCCVPDSIEDMCYRINHVEHFIVFDLGEPKSFNNYTLYNAGFGDMESFNASSWELFVSDDGKRFASVDFEENIDVDAASFAIEPVTARYIMLKVYKSDSEGGTVRLYELRAGMVE